MRCCIWRRTVRRRLLLQLSLGTILALLYLQFQLLSSTEKFSIIKTFRKPPASTTPEHIDWASHCGLRRTFERATTSEVEKDSFFATWQHAGALNEFGWREIRGGDLNSLVKHPLFPKIPSHVGFVSNMSSWLPKQVQSYGRWMFGFLLPDVTGEYRFAIASDDSSELWVSLNEDHNNVRLVASVGERSDPGWTAPGQHIKYPKQTSENIRLYKCHKYFMEVFHKQGAGDGFVELSWKRPGMYEFETIKSFHTSPLIAARSLSVAGVLQRRYPELVEVLDRHAEAREEAAKETGRQDTAILSFLRDNMAKDILPHCPQTPPVHLNDQQDATDKNASRSTVIQVFPLFEKKIPLESPPQRLVTWQRISRDYALSEMVARGAVSKFVSALHAHYPGWVSWLFFIYITIILTVTNMDTWSR